MNILNYITEAKIDASWVFNSEKTGSKKMTEKVTAMMSIVELTITGRCRTQIHTGALPRGQLTSIW